MIGAASSLRSLDDALSADDRHELLDSVISEGERLNRYIQNLLDMTRLGLGTLKLERDWIGIDDILNSTLRRTRELLHDCRLVRNIEPGLPLLYVHPALIEQALVNVIENAAKFSPAGGEVRVTAARDEGEILITVSDEGPGIPPDQREKVFNIFHRWRGRSRQARQRIRFGHLQRHDRRPFRPHQSAAGAWRQGNHHCHPPAVACPPDANGENI